MGRPGGLLELVYFPEVVLVAAPELPERTFPEASEYAALDIPLNVQLVACFERLMVRVAGKRLCEIVASQRGGGVGRWNI